MDRKVTIEMSWTDAMTANSIMSDQLRENIDVINNYLAHGEDVPNSLERETEELHRVVQILHEAVTSQ